MVSISTGENPRSSRLTIGARNQFGWMMPVGRGEFLPLSGQSSGHPGGAEADVKARIGKARAAFLQLKNVWSSKDLRLQTKIWIFNSNVKLVLQPVWLGDINNGNHKEGEDLHQLMSTKTVPLH